MPKKAENLYPAAGGIFGSNFLTVTYFLFAVTLLF